MQEYIHGNGDSQTGYKRVSDLVEHELVIRASEYDHWENQTHPLKE